LALDYSQQLLLRATMAAIEITTTAIGEFMPNALTATGLKAIGFSVAWIIIFKTITDGNYRTKTNF
jgi:hypothetical protein